MSLETSIREAQKIADEQAVLQSLRNKGLADLRKEEEPEQQCKDQIDKLVKEGKLPKEAGFPEEEKLKKLKELGNRFNQGKLQWHLVDFKALEPMVKVLMYGKDKYSENQWKNGLSLKDTLDSLLRHTTALLAGEVNDEESGLSHIGHIFCNALFYSYFTEVNTINARP